MVLTRKTLAVLVVAVLAFSWPAPALSRHVPKGKAAMIAPNIQPEGAQAVEQAFRSLDTRAADLSPAWPEVARVVYTDVSRRFATEGEGGWPGLTEAHAKRKRARYGVRKILSASGALEASLTTTGAPFSIYEETPDALTLGSTLVYAVAHQEGVLERSLPQREIYVATEALAQEVADVVERSLLEHARGLGLAP